jgi:hypothetical protein
MLGTLQQPTNIITASNNAITLFIAHILILYNYYSWHTFEREEFEGKSENRS